jgi:hypothetical protein
MTFVIVGEADCEPGKFMDEVQPEARRKGTEIDARPLSFPAPRPGTADVIAALVVAVRESQDVLDYFARFASTEERQVADARLARNREALHLYRRWVTP